MNAHSPSAYTLSMLLHGAFAAALLFTAFALRENTARKSTEVFELVAGAGDNWAATEAPALGSPTGIEFKPAPTPPAPQPKLAPPEPVAPAPSEPSPIAPAPVQAAAPPKTAPKPAPTKAEKTLTEQIQQQAKRKERQIVSKFRREEAARAKAEAKAAELAAKRMTKEEFDRLNGRKVATNSKSGAVTVPKISTKGITSGVGGGTTDKPGAGGKALSRAEQAALGTYFEMLKQKVKAAHVMPPDASDRLSARVSFYVAANGAVGQVKILRSSGNAEFDESVLAAFRAVRSIGPRPDDRGDAVELEFTLRDGE